MKVVMIKSIRETTEGFVYDLFDKFTNLVYESGEETEFEGIKVLKEKHGFITRATKYTVKNPKTYPTRSL